MLQSIKSLLSARSLVTSFITAIALYTASAPAFSLTLVYSSNFQGEIEPCGCTMEGDYGGVARRTTMLDKLKEANPDLVLISSGGIFNSIASSAEIINHAIVNGFKMNKFDFVGVQSIDVPHLEKHPLLNELPWVSSEPSVLNQPYSRTIEREGVKVSYYALSKQEQNFEQGLTALRDHLAKQKDHLVIISIESRSPYEELIPALIKEGLVNILIQPQRDEFFVEPKLENKTLVLRPGNRGMRLGKLTINPANPHIDFSHETIELGVDVPDSPRTKAWYDAYNQAVINFFRKDADKKPDAASPVYMGAQTCRTCHLDIYEKWESTLHAKAFSRLEAVNKTEDPNCVGCHVAGYNETGGYIDAEKSAHLQNVQCESCHGGGFEHTINPIMKKPTKHHLSSKEKCLQCHVKDHSPSFEFDTYWPRVAH